MRYVLTAHPATDALTVLPLIRFLERSLAAAVVWQIIGTALFYASTLDFLQLAAADEKQCTFFRASTLDS